MAQRNTSVQHEKEKPPCQTELIHPDSFEPHQHFYPKVLNASLHPMVGHFLSLSHQQLLTRYCHLHPEVNPEKLLSIIRHTPKAIFWAGADLFYVATASGQRKMVVIETNSCPSGQKSMPIFQEHSEESGYQLLIEQSFKPLLKGKRLPKGGLAVLYDKNKMGNSGYAAAMADAFDEPVYLVPCMNGEPEACARFNAQGVLEVLTPEDTWAPIRAAFRYVTQKPWNRIPLETKTFIYNPILACLAGGRNKLLAGKAYSLFNHKHVDDGLVIQHPETIMDVSKEEVPLWVSQFGGKAVIKNPYSNAGQGVYTITSEAELETFMAEEHPYQQFIVQSLIGNKNWSSITQKGQFFHIGMVPNKKKQIYISDLRAMICWTKEGFKPVSFYARRARSPLHDSVEGASSWDMLGTNLSVKEGENRWDTETSRLVLMDKKDFNRLGIGIDDLIEAFIQTVLSTVAIDQMAAQLIGSNGKFRKKLFASLDADETLMEEIYSR